MTRHNFCKTCGRYHAVGAPWWWWAILILALLGIAGVHGAVLWEIITSDPTLHAGPEKLAALIFLSAIAGYFYYFSCFLFSRLKKELIKSQRRGLGGRNREYDGELS